MTQAQAVIALRDAAEAGGDYIIDTDRDRHIGAISGNVRLNKMDRISFTILPVKVTGRRYPRQIVGARVLSVRKDKLPMPPTGPRVRA